MSAVFPRPGRKICGKLLCIAAALVAAPQAAQAQVRLDSQMANLADDLVAANRILYNQGVVDGFGHISARSPANSGHFYMARSMAPSSVTQADIMEFDADGNPAVGDTRVAYAERFIHSEIYKARPDVMAVVHAHAPSVIGFSITGVPLRPVYHMSGFLGKAVPVFEIRDALAAHPESDLLVRSPALGAKLADRLGRNAAVLMRGHGFTVVAPSVPVAVFRAVYTDQNARIQSEALKLGLPKYLSEQEAALTQQTMEGLSTRSWEMWKKQAGLAP